MPSSPEREPSLTHRVISLRLKITELLIKAGVISKEGLLPDGSVVPDFVDSQGVDVEGLADVCGDEVVERIENSLTSGADENPPWSKKTEAAREKHHRNDRFGKEGEVLRGPGRYGGKRPWQEK